jgi:epoxyqueuosine reductase
VALRCYLNSNHKIEPVEPTQIREKVKKKAKELGFELCGFAPARPFPETAAFGEWLEKGYHGTMEYMARGKEKRQDIEKILPGARSVIVVGMIYNTDHPYSTCGQRKKSQGWISRYAWGSDYHKVLLKKLRILEQFVAEEISSGEVSKGDSHLLMKAYVDTGPILERVYGKYAGLGWIGKNTCLINEKLGSWFFLGEIVTTLDLAEKDLAPSPDHCGSCCACIDACPTGAIVKPYVLDASRCISYLTIEHRGKIKEALRNKMGDHIFGCDICQDVCPWNRRAATTENPEFQPRPGLFAPELASLSKLSEEEFRQRFHGSPVKRTKYSGFMRNVTNAQRSKTKNQAPSL